MTLLGSWARHCALRRGGSQYGAVHPRAWHEWGAWARGNACHPCVCIATCLHEAVGTRVLSPHGRTSVLFRLESILWFWGLLSPCPLPLMRS